MPARLALAAMNASMVGILCRPRVSTGDRSAANRSGVGVEDSASNGAHSVSATGSVNRTRASGISQVHLSLSTPTTLPTTSSNNDATSIPTPRRCSIFFDDQHSGGSCCGSNNSEEGDHHGLWPCLGMGIVRCIDLDRSLLYLITPVAVELLQAAEAEKTGMSVYNPNSF